MRDKEHPPRKKKREGLNKKARKKGEGRREREGENWKEKEIRRCISNIMIYMIKKNRWTTKKSEG